MHLFTRAVLALLVGLLPSFLFGSTDVTIEAESATISGSHTVEVNENASGGNFAKLNNNGSTNGTIIFTVNNIPSNGTYKVEVFHFNGGVNQSVDVTINNDAVSTKSLQKSNWAYQDKARSTLWTLDLVAGTNTIALEAAHVALLIDKIKITDNFNIYYIASNGDDSNNGSYWNPWKTVEKASTAFETNGNGGFLNPGDRILFRSGDIFKGELKVKRSGAEGNPITISYYGPGELPILSGSGNITGGDYLSAVNLVNASYITLSHVWVKNDRQNDTRYGWNDKKSFGVYCQANKWGGISKGLTFHDLKITDVYSVGLPEDFDAIKVTGLRFESDANEEDAGGSVTTEIRFADVRVENCYFSHIGKAGIWATHSGDWDNSDWTINRNMNFVIKDNTFLQTGGSGVILGKMYNALVENNDFDQTGYSNGTETRLAGRGSGLWTFRCKHVIAQYNRSYNVKGNGDSYGMHIDFGNEDVIFQYNYSENSEGGFCEILGSNNRCTYRFNVSVNDGYRDNHGNTLWISGFVGSGNAPIRSDSNYIYNNTIYLTANYTPNIEIYASNTYIYNNAFMTSGSGSIASEGEVIDIANGSMRVSHNYFRGNISTSFQNRDNNKVTDGWPSFHDASASAKTGFQIYATSAFVDAGRSFSQPAFPMAGQGIFENIPEYPTVDAFGNPVDIENQAPNIGADNNHSANTFCTTATGTDTKTACDAYTWIDGVTYTENNNTATHTIVGGAANGCDSVVTLNLTIKQSPTQVTTSITNETCGQTDGSILFSFPDARGRTAIEFSTDGGQTYPRNVNDNIGSTPIGNLSSGDYNLFVRWGNDECPVDLGTVTIEEINCIYDCNGDLNGSATIDACGICSGGLTNVTPSSPQTWYADTDNDGLGDPNSSVENCNQPNGYAANADDQCPNDATNTCNDPRDCNGDINGTATIDACGVCSGGLTNVTPSSPQTWYADTDNDGLGDPNSSVENCNQPNGYVANADDQCPNDETNTCNDPRDCNGDINGTATIDACGVCSGGLTNVTPSSPQTWYADTDNDGLGDPNSSVENCEQPNGYVANADDQCPNDPTNTCKDPKDCNGDINGKATIDECGVCSGGLTQIEACQQDCNGDWGGTAEIDNCDVCSGGNTNIEANTCVNSLEVKTNNTISLYPNPTNGYIYLSEKSSWEVLDLYGNVLTVGEGNKIDLMDVPAGVYVIITGSQSHKVIKQ